MTEIHAPSRLCRLARPACAFRPLRPGPYARRGAAARRRNAGRRRGQPERRTGATENEGWGEAGSDRKAEMCCSAAAAASRRTGDECRGRKLACDTSARGGAGGLRA